jgi:glutamate:GABA antiporter
LAETKDAVAADSGTSTGSGLKRELGLRDLTLFYVVSLLTVRWIASAAASGPSSIAVWALALVGFFIPLVASVLELSSRYPQAGGLYIWTQHAYGDFAGFMSGWTYWMSNLAYFPAILYFAAGSLLFAGGSYGKALENESVYYMTFAVGTLALITFLNMRGVKQGKWLNNAGAIGGSLPILILVALSVLFWRQHGSATRFTLTAMTPHLNVKNAVFWSTIFYAFAGAECASCMGDEIREPRRTVPRGLLLAGIVVTLGYMLGTLAMLVVMPSDRISGLGGFMTVMAEMCRGLGVSWLTPIVALMVTIASLGAAGAYLSATARIPFVAGIDNYLPAAFSRVHPRWNTPYVSVLVYGVTGMIFAFLGQAATNVKGAYDVLVSMSVISYFIPYVFLFASTLRLQRVPAGPEVFKVPGGRPVAIALALIGMASTLITIGLSTIPADDEPNKPLAVFKTVGMTALLIALGVGVYAMGRRRVLRKQEQAQLLPEN